MSPVMAQVRTATRLARLLRTVAADRDAWVSTEARVALPSGLRWAPAVVVETGQPPYDGVLEHPPLLAVETAPAAVERGEAVHGVTVWGVFDGAVRISRDGRTRRIGAQRPVTVPRARWLRASVAELLEAVQG